MEQQQDKQITRIREPKQTFPHFFLDALVVAEVIFLVHSEIAYFPRISPYEKLSKFVKSLIKSRASVRAGNVVSTNVVSTTGVELSHSLLSSKSKKLSGNVLNSV